MPTNKLKSANKLKSTNKGHSASKPQSVNQPKPFLNELLSAALFAGDAALWGTNMWSLVSFWQG
jgi:hypothetical protein